MAAKQSSAPAENLEERVKARQERLSEKINAETPFNKNPEVNISALAQKAYPENKEEQDRYKAKITASLEKHVNGSIDELWKYLEENYCRTTAIIEGILRFFAGEKGEKEIGLDRFLKPMTLSAESDIDKTYHEEREATIRKTKNDLSSLLDEIREAHPNV